MKYIEKKVKGYKKKYKKANGVTKTTTDSLSIYLGAKTSFKRNETVVIANRDYFYSLLDSDAIAIDSDSKHSDIASELEGYKETVLELSRINDTYFQELSRIKQQLEKKDNELYELNKELKEKNNKIESLYIAIMYYKDIIAEYKGLSIFRRLFKYSVSKEIDNQKLIDIEK